jgi:hypothetical protein
MSRRRRSVFWRGAIRNPEGGDEPESRARVTEKSSADNFSTNDNHDFILALWYTAVLFLYHDTVCTYGSHHVCV